MRLVTYADHLRAPRTSACCATTTVRRIDFDGDMVAFIEAGEPALELRAAGLGGGAAGARSWRRCARARCATS